MESEKLLGEIKSLTQNRKYCEAINACETALMRFPYRKVDVLRLRAYAYTLQGNYESALADRRDNWMTKARY